MGITPREESKALFIRVHGGNNAEFAPGGTIVGVVSRQIPTVATHATVKITLCGRTKSKIVISRGNNNKSYYRGRFSTIDEAALSTVVFSGPIHIANFGAGGEPPAATEWPFAIDIPTHCNARRIANSVPAEQAFMPLDAASVAAHELPGSFHMDHDGWNSDREGFVEYYLKASISMAAQGSAQYKESTLPVRVVQRSPDPPIVDFRLARHRCFGAASSFHLLPGMEDAELTFSQKRQQLFGSSKVPRIGGQMEVDVPRVVQLDNPNPVSVRLRFVPDPKATSSGMRGVPAKIVLQSLSFTILSRTVVRCDGTFRPHDDSDDAETRLRVWPPRPGQEYEPLYIPCTDEWPAVDVGARAGFRVHARTGPSSFLATSRLSPDFTTFNIRHSHRARFDIVCKVADREIKLSVGGELEVLRPSEGTAGTSTQQAAPAAPVVQADAPVEEEPPPPFQGRSESWIQPPAEADAPPTFAEVQKEDEVRKSADERPEAVKA